MRLLFETISTRLGEAWRSRRAPTAHRAFQCQCGRPVFFRNSVCLACGTPLGYATDVGRVLPLVPGPQPDTWQAHPRTDWTDGIPEGDHIGQLYRRCGNFSGAAACNWLVPLEAPGSEAPQADDGGALLPRLCVSCGLNRTIPDLSVPANQALWQRIELAKRRLVSSLLALGLPVVSKLGGGDPEHGLAFDFLAPTADMPTVMTGHAGGLITLNLEEADDAKREQRRVSLHEPYRTLLGHLRHEVGHYYWDRLVDGTEWHEPFRALFGDEREDYGEALNRHYANGPRPDWQGTHVSAYASAHPWEDWAETWAHYLHMVDTLDTALSFGIDTDRIDIHYEPFTAQALYHRPGGSLPVQEAVAFLSFVNAWTELTGVLNELSRSMGQTDFYPFVLSAAAVTKLHFVHQVVMAAQQDEDARASQAAGAQPAAAAPSTDGPEAGPAAPPPLPEVQEHAWPPQAAVEV